MRCTNLVEHSIDTGSNRHIRQALRQYPRVHLNIIDQQVDELFVKFEHFPFQNKLLLKRIYNTKQNNSKMIVTPPWFLVSSLAGMCMTLVRK